VVQKGLEAPDSFHENGKSKGRGGGQMLERRIVAEEDDVIAEE